MLNYIDSIFVSVFAEKRFFHMPSKFSQKKGQDQSQPTIDMRKNIGVILLFASAFNPYLFVLLTFL